MQCKTVIMYSEKYLIGLNVYEPGRKAQSVTCLTADPWVTSLFSVLYYTYMEIDHKLISTIVLLPSADSRRVVVSYKQKNVHKVLVNRLVRLSQEKSMVR